MSDEKRRGAGVVGGGFLLLLQRPVAPCPGRRSLGGMRAIPVALALFLAASVAHAEEAPAAPSPEPSRGTVFLVLGSLGIAGAVANFATLPLCVADRVPSSQRPACIGTGAGVGGALLGAGIPLVVLGVARRAAWLKWTTGARVGVANGGASLTWGASW